MLPCHATVQGSTMAAAGLGHGQAALEAKPGAQVSEPQGPQGQRAGNPRDPKAAPLAWPRAPLGHDLALPPPSCRPGLWHGMATYFGK